MLGFTKEELESRNGIFTVEEILQQPETWKKTAAQVEAVRAELNSFIDGVTGEDDYEIILTGAGTSEYVGNSLFPALLQGHRGRIHSIGTTDIVATPEAYIPEDKPLLLVSFARSGNSPESVGAVKAVDRICSKAKHLFITCNKDGALAKIAEGREECFSLLLTPETHDRSFAMTSSFTNMYLAALMALSGAKAEEFEGMISAGAEFGTEGYKAVADFMAANDFNRIVYLGTDVLKGIAQEAALKILELTAGQVVALHDSPMGFRHGPKSVADDNTVTVVFISENPATRRYEMDLLAEIYRDRGEGKVVAITSVADAAVTDNCDLAVTVDMKADADGGFVPNSKLALPYIMAAQTLATLNSLKLGITPDNPCPTGEVNRVVKGVTIYE